MYRFPIAWMLALSTQLVPASLQGEPPPAQTPIQTSTLEAGPTQTWAGEPIQRASHLHPSIWGQVGLFRVRSAYSLPAGGLTFGLGGEFSSVGQGPNLGLGPTRADTIAENLFVGYAVTDAFQLSVTRRNSSTTFAAPAQPSQLISSLGDFTFGGHYQFELTPSLSLAPIANFMVASNFNNLAPAGSTLSGGLGAALTFAAFDWLGIPLFLHTNLFYHSPHIQSVGPATLAPEIFFQFTRYHSLSWALGAEWHLGDWIPFAEYTNANPMGSGLGLFNAPSQITLGTRWTPLQNKGFAVLAGVDIGTGRTIFTGVPFTPPARVVGMVSYTLGLTSSERQHYYTTQDVNVVDRRFVIRKKIEFKVGSHELMPSSTGLLNQIANVVLKNHVNKLLIVGHTDSSHTEDYNLKLSIARANSVKRYLVSRGVDEATLMTQGYGKRKPRASNATEDGRAKNRRVEFFILE